MAHCGVLEPEKGNDISDSMWWYHCGSLAWGVGAQTGIHGCGVGQGATEDWLYIRETD